MKSTLKIVVILLTSFFNLNAQTLAKNIKEYYDLVNEAKWSSYKKDFQKAFLLYQKAFSIDEPQAKDVQNFINCSIALKYNDTADVWIRFAIRSFGFRLDELIEDSISLKQNIKKDENNLMASFLTDADRRRDIFYVEHYLLNDFFFRSEIQNFNFLECENLKKDFGFSLAIQYDSIYAIPFALSLIEKYNFPNASDIGNYYADNFYFLLRHYNIPKELLDSALIKGKIPPKEYASIVDYHFNFDWETLKPKDNYGPNLIKINSQYKMGFIDNIETVDERRAKIGLMPLWQEAKSNKWPYLLSEEYILMLKNKAIQTE